MSCCVLPLSKRDIELLLKLTANLNMLLKDKNVNMVKKAILTMTQLYKVALQVRDPLGAGKWHPWVLGDPPVRFNPSLPTVDGEIEGDQRVTGSLLGDDGGHGQRHHPPPRLR